MPGLRILPSPGAKSTTYIPVINYATHDRLGARLRKGPRTD